MGAPRAQALSRQGHPTAEGCVLSTSSSSPHICTAGSRRWLSGCRARHPLPRRPCITQGQPLFPSSGLLWEGLGVSTCLCLPLPPRRTPGSQCQPHT